MDEHTRWTRFRKTCRNTSNGFKSKGFFWEIETLENLNIHARKNWTPSILQGNVESGEAALAQQQKEKIFVDWAGSNDFPWSLRSQPPVIVSGGDGRRQREFAWKRKRVSWHGGFLDFALIQCNYTLPVCFPAPNCSWKKWHPFDKLPRANWSVPWMNENDGKLITADEKFSFSSALHGREKKTFTWSGPLVYSAEGALSVLLRGGTSLGSARSQARARGFFARLEKLEARRLGST